MAGSARMLLGARRWVTIPIACAIALAAVGIVQAVTTSDPGPFVGCLASKTTLGSGTTKGQLYNVAKTGPTAPCLKGDAQIVFSNAQGPKGDKGDKGDQGIQGIQGIQGPKGDPGLNPEQFWTFDIPASAGNEEFVSAAGFPAGVFDDHHAFVTSEAGGYAFAHGDAPAGCDFAKMDLRISSGTKNLLDWDISTPHTFQELGAPARVGTRDGDPAGFGLKIVVRCFQGGDDVDGTPIDGHPTVHGLLFFHYEAPPAGFDGAVAPLPK